MKNLFFKALMIGLLLLALPMKQYGQEVRKIKISELNISSIRTICGEDEKSIWIVCGYQNVEETLDPHAVNIFPNPNDGNMILSFDNMEGENLIKVYNITARWSTSSHSTTTPDIRTTPTKLEDSLRASTSSTSSTRKAS